MRGKPATFGLLLLIFLMQFWMVGEVYVNGLPVERRGDPLGTVLAIEPTEVSIIGENLSIVFEEEQGYFLPPFLRARITAVYKMNNPQDRTQVVSLLFVGYRAEETVAALNGQKINVGEMGTQKLRYYFPDLARMLRSVWVDPLTGRVTLPPEKTDLEPQAVPLTIELQPGLNRLEISYLSMLGLEQDKYLNPICHLSYFLQPAKYWASFGNLEITVQLPHERYFFTSSLPLENRGKGLWQGSFTGLPQEDLHLSLLSKQGMWFGRYTTKVSLWVGLVLLTGAAIVNRKTGFFLPKRYKEGLSIALHVIIALYGWNVLTLPFLPAPFNVLVLAQIPILAILLIWSIKEIIMSVRLLTTPEEKAF